VGIRPVLFEDHTLMHFRPLAWSVPVPEIRCGLFSARERVDLVQPGGGLLAVRPELASLVRAPGWQALPAAPASGQTLWLSGRLAPDCRQVSALLAAAAAGEFALTDTSGLLAMAAGAGGSVVAESWTRWAAGNLAAPQAGTALPAWSPPLPATWDRIDVGSGLVWHRPQEGGAPPPAELAPSLAWIWNIVPRTPAAIQADIAAVRDGEWRRWPFGLDPDPAGPEPVWCRPSRLQTAPAGLRSAHAGTAFLSASCSVQPSHL